MRQPGTVLDKKYQIETVVGRGGFGYVYCARERLTGEIVAIKELVPSFVSDLEMVQRFVQEARATLRLKHAHIARTYSIFRDHGTFYLAMEYLPGGSLADRLERGPLDVDESVRIALSLCEALHYAHQRGVVHCDIKPANVLFDEDDEVQLVDFGIAYVSADAMTRRFYTATGTETLPPGVQPAQASFGETWTRPADGATMVYVPAGAFEMGSEEGDRNEDPVHTLSLDGFWIERYEVTSAQFAAFINDEAQQGEDVKLWLNLGDEDCLIEQSGDRFQSKSGYADNPVVEVSWYGAAAYSTWVGGRLPSEAEWEKAARGTEGRKHPWGHAAPTDELCNFSFYVTATTPVGTYSPEGDSPYGCADMAGNVVEWTRSLDRGYPDDPHDGREAPDVDSYRVLRGGSFINRPQDVRCARRITLSPDFGWDGKDIGFRVMMTPYAQGPDSCPPVRALRGVPMAGAGGVRDQVGAFIP
jgi:formylglycine-generating enzyme required for sulfatase activity